MQFIFTTNALTTPCFLPHFTTPPHRRRPNTLNSRPPISRFPSQTLKYPLKFRAFCFSEVPFLTNPSKPHKKKKFFGYPFGSIRGREGEEGSGEGRVLEGFRVGGGGNNGVFDWWVLRPVVLVVLCVVIGFVPVRGFQAPTAALPSISGLMWRRKKKAETKVPDHEYSRYTKSLLDEVYRVLKMMEEVRESKREVRDVENALKEVKRKSKEMQEEILRGLYRKLRELYREREDLVSALDDVSDGFSVAKAKEDELLDHLKSGRVADEHERKTMESQVEDLEATLDGLATKNDQLSEKIADVEERIEKMEMKALSIGVRELSFIEEECEHLVSHFVKDMRLRPSTSLKENLAARLSRDDIQKGLEVAQKEYLKQRILPSLVEVNDPGLPWEGVETDFAMRIKHALDESRELQSMLEGDVRKKMKKFGDEKRFVVKTPDEEVSKGYPEAELKWMFGSKEIVVPKAVRILLYHGWKKWREEAKADLKKELLQNVDLGREYMMRRQERIILDRDRIVSRTVYNKEKNRWEMDPIAVPFAVSKNLVEYARIRQDWAEMFVGLKGDDKEYRVDIKEYDILFEDFGGFDTLYLKMVASGIPTVVQAMWIPFSEWNLYQYVRLLANLAPLPYHLLRDSLHGSLHGPLRGSLLGLLHGLSSSEPVSRVKDWSSQIIKYTNDDWISQIIKNTNEDILVTILPVVEFILPIPLKLRLGTATGEELYQSEEYRFWKFELQHRFEKRSENIFWIPWLLFISYIYWRVVSFVCCVSCVMLSRVLSMVLSMVLSAVLSVVLQLIPYVIRNFPWFGFKFGRIDVYRSANLRKLGRLKFILDWRMRKIQQIMSLWKKHNKSKSKPKPAKSISEDPIRSVIEDPVRTIVKNMKRVKNPPISLSQFAGIGKIREEINEVVMFLKDPRAFQKVGARAPRGVLIVGDEGTDERSLALAIAAEAKVPMAEVKPEQLEAGFPGQGAANVRELFQTARELAPVILFVENFESLAVARGSFMDIEKQEHESVINQLLVELDGFEKQEGVLLLATTSIKGLGKIDPALLRPGRMDRIFRLDPPKPEFVDREMILLTAARNTMDPEFVDFVDWKKVEEKTRLLPITDLDSVPMALEANALRNKITDTDELISYLSWFAALGGVIPTWLRRSSLGQTISSMLINHLGLTLTKEDVQYVINHMDPYGEVENGIELLTPSNDWTRETKLPYAVWAAGRSLTALLLPNFDKVEHIWLEPNSWKGIGFTKITDAKEGSAREGKVETRVYFEKKLVFCFGSYVAAQLLLPPEEENVLSRIELKQAQEIALTMVIEYGWGPNDSPTIYWHSQKTKPYDGLTELERESEIATSIQKLYDSAYDKAFAMLRKNRGVLEKIVDELLDVEVMSGKDLERILDKNGGVREVEPFSLSGVCKDESLLYINFLEGEGPSGKNVLGAPA